MKTLAFYHSFSISMSIFEGEIAILLIFKLLQAATTLFYANLR